MLTMRFILLLTCGSLLGPISHTSANHPRFDSRTARTVCYLPSA